MAKETFQNITRKIDGLLHPYLETYSSPLAQKLFRPNALTDTQDMYGIIIHSSCKLIARHTARRYVYGAFSTRSILTPAQIATAPKQPPKQTKHKPKKEKEQKTKPKVKKKDESYYPEDEQEMELCTRGSKTQVTYKQWSHVIEIDLTSFTISHDKFLLIDFIKAKTEQKCITGASKHVFLIHDINIVHPHVARALLNCMEKCHSYAYFVFSSTKLNHIVHSAFVNLCAFVKNDFRTLDFINDVYLHTLQHINLTPDDADNHFLEDEERKHLFLKRRSEIQGFVQGVYAKARHDLFETCVLCELPCGHRFRGYLPVKIEAFLLHLKETPSEEILASETIRKTTHQLMGASVPFKEVVTHTLAYFSRRYSENNPDIMVEVVALSAQMEHDMQLSHKPIYIWENYFNALMIALKDYKDYKDYKGYKNIQ